MPLLIRSVEPTRTKVSPGPRTGSGPMQTLGYILKTYLGMLGTKARCQATFMLGVLSHCTYHTMFSSLPRDNSIYESLGGLGTLATSPRVIFLFLKIF